MFSFLYDTLHHILPTAAHPHWPPRRVTPARITTLPTPNSKCQRTISITSSYLTITHALARTLPHPSCHANPTQHAAQPPDRAP